MPTCLLSQIGSSAEGDGAREGAGEGLVTSAGEGVGATSFPRDDELGPPNAPLAY